MLWLTYCSFTAKKSLPASTNNLVDAKWAWFERNVGVVENFRARLFYTRSVPTPIRLYMIRFFEYSYAFVSGY